MDDSEMSICIDMTAQHRIAAGDTWTPPNLRANLAEKVGSKGFALTKTCAEQFPGRAVLASCTTTKQYDNKAKDRSGSTKVVENYYGYAEVFESRDDMRECLKGGGEWSSVSEDSPEYRRARVDRHARQLLK